MDKAPSRRPKVIDFEISDLRESVRKCFPEVPTGFWQYVDDGVACYVFLAGKNGPQTVFRFPRFDFVAEKVLREVELLRSLREAVPLDIPSPEFVCTGTVEYPWPFMGYPFIDGLQLTKKVLAQTQSAETPLNVARQIGYFLTCLHAWDMQRALAIGMDVDCGLDSIAELWDEVQEKVFPLFDHRQRTWTAALFEEVLANDSVWAFTPAVIHGDLGDQHILIDTSSCKINGIIDFGEARIGDPAFDIADLSRSYGKVFARAVMSQYTLPVDAAFWARVRIYSQSSCLRAIVYGLELGRTDYVLWGIAQHQKPMEGWGTHSVSP